MKEEQRTVAVYIADDGKEFLSSYACRTYEEEKTISNDRREWLNKSVIAYMKTIPGIIEHCKNLSLQEQEEWIEKNIFINCFEEKTFLGYKEDGGYISEFDENCPFEHDLWWELEKTIYTRYGYKIKDSSYYWPK